ncbi:TonB-dependent receptor domain-containing protein [Asticcacaulis sp. W401b]|uniref:TonB-dependent receptor n=1 Tax=Asticcacaulis sp. W401b TaxID=3388666 RepID=UPI003970F355
MINKSKRSGLMVSTTLCGALLSAVALTAITSVVPTVAVAQDLTSGTLAGTVKSEEGKAAAGATVVITGESNGYTTTAKTGVDGTFKMSQIPLGRYTVSITTASGAKAEETVLVTLGAVSNYEFTAGGSSVETVVVRGKARRNLDFDRTTTGSVLDVQTVAERIPVGRSIEALADLVPGITINDVFGPPSISGASPAENIYYVNGMNVTNFRNFLGGTTIPFDFYEQIEVKTGGYSAEYGRSTGGAFIATTRSGSNTFKGGVSLYYTPDSLASKSQVVASDLNDADSDLHTYFQGRTGIEQKEANVWLSGPIVKDHVYFFAFYNPRDFSQSSRASYGDGSTNYVEEAEQKDPFWGGKLDFVLNPNHRLEVTYFSDDQTEATHHFDAGDPVDKLVNNSTGGKTQVYKYTGKFTDWFTLSMLYGKSSYNQTIKSFLDDANAVFLDGAVVRGNPAILVEEGDDNRENFRVDGDFYFNLLGKHHLKVGYDLEQLTANVISRYSGGGYYRYYNAGSAICGGAGSAQCVRLREYSNSGGFDVENTSFYAQDSWEINDRLALNLGLRADKFTNKNAAGDAFIETDYLIAPRVGLSYDVYGDKSMKMTAFFGRYYLPIAGNTNIRLAGGELFTQKVYTWTTRDANTLVPTLGTLISEATFSNGSIPEASTLVSQNIDPQYQDEFIVGVQKRFENGWKAGVTFTYRKLGAAMEDVNLYYVNNDVCSYLGIDATSCNNGTFGGSGYVLLNPGKDAVITLGSDFGTTWGGRTVTIPADVLGYPEAKRNYQGVTFDFERPWDGKWSLGGSLTLSSTKGNIEGGVKSDNGQDDTGLTQDFDEVGWTDGSFGFLPNHHGYNLKAFGTYQFNDNLRGGFNASILSPRKYGCIGYYPTPSDGRAVDTTLTAWYCDSKLTPRGSSFDGDWIKRLDLNLTWEQPIPIGTVKLTADVFNVFNAKGADQFHEDGEYTGVGEYRETYAMPSSYQTPRYVRLGLKYEF